MKKGFFLTLCFSLLFLPACGGGGGGGGTKTPTSSVSAAGLWSGTVTDSTGYTFDVQGIISSDNEVRVFSLSEGTQYEAHIEISNNKATGEFTGYAPEGYTFYNGSKITSGNISMTITEKESIEGSYSSPGDSGTFSLTYDPYAKTETSLQDMEGSWGYSDLGEWVDISISKDGSFTGSDDMGCVFNGNLSLPDSSWRIYDIDMSVSQCGEYNGTYTGLSTIVNSNQDSLWSVSNGVYSVLELLSPAR